MTDPEAGEVTSVSPAGDTEVGPGPAEAAPGQQLVARPPAGLVTVEDGELLARVERARTERERRVAAETLAATATGGPCRYCGTTWSTRWERAREVGGWHPGPCCEACFAEAGELHGGAALATDREHRARVARRLLREIDPVEVDQWGDDPSYGLVAKSGFKWWSETEGAKPGGRRRFAYLSPQQLVANLKAPPSGGVPLVTGPPCERCGCTDRWEARAVHHQGTPGSTVLVGWTEHRRTCRGPCLGMPEDVDQAAALLVGLQPAPGVAEALGVSWWSAHLAALPLRQQYRARRHGPDRPLGWWPDRASLLARAWQRYGLQPGEWARTAEGRWTSLAAMRAAEAVAGELAARVQ